MRHWHQAMERENLFKLSAKDTLLQFDPNKLHHNCKEVIFNDSNFGFQNFSVRIKIM